MSTVEEYDAYATITDFAERERVSRLASRMAEIESAPSKMAAYRTIGEQEGISAKSMERLYAKWKKGGDLALADKRKMAKATPGSKFYEDFKTYAERDMNSDQGGYDAMMRDFRAGKCFSFGTWRDVFREEFPFSSVPPLCPANWTPKGMTYKRMNQLHNADPNRQISIAWCRGGAFAASAHTLPVIRSRVGLAVGQVFQADDVWHNIDVFASGMAGTFQPMEFAIYDVASAFKVVSCIKPRLLNTDPKTGKETRDNLKEAQFRFAMQYLVAVKGFHKDGATFVLERGTTAIRENVQRRVAGVPYFGKLVKFETSGILKDAAHKGLLLGNAGGNPRMKSLCECAHNIIHNATASLLGNRGRDAAHMHESERAAVKYTEEMLELANRIDPALIPYLQLPKLRFDDYLRYFYTLEDFVMDRTNHNLEGWADREVVEYRLSRSQDVWFPVSRLADMSPAEATATLAVVNADKDALFRSRKMSRREVWNAGQRDLVRWPLFDLPAWADPRDARTATVNRDGTISFSDALYFPGHKQIYLAEYCDRNGLRTRLAPGSSVRFYWNPLGELANQIWITNEADNILGVAPILKTAAWTNRASIEAAMGQKLEHMAAQMADTRARHADDAAQRLAAQKVNEFLLEAGREAKRDELAQGNETPALEVLDCAAPAPASDENENENADALDFLKSLA